RHPAEQRAEKRATEWRYRGQQSFLGGREMQFSANERPQRTQDYPDHKADVEIEKSGDQRRHVARLAKFTKAHFFSLGCGTEVAPIAPPYVPSGIPSRRMVSNR